MKTLREYRIRVTMSDSQWDVASEQKLESLDDSVVEAFAAAFIDRNEGDFGSRMQQFATDLDGIGLELEIEEEV